MRVSEGPSDLFSDVLYFDVDTCIRCENGKGRTGKLFQSEPERFARRRKCFYVGLRKMLLETRTQVHILEKLAVLTRFSRVVFFYQKRPSQAPNDKKVSFQDFLSGV